MKKTVFGILFFSLGLFSAYPKDIAMEPTGIYKTIDTRLTVTTIKSLQSSSSKARLNAIKKITNSPEDYAPPAFYLLSSVLWRDGKKDDAMFWFYAGQLRGSIDANICADKSAGDAMEALNQKFGSEINQYAFTDISKLTNTVEKVIAWEEKTPCKYDRRWINLHGMNAFLANTNSPLSAATDRWEAIRKTTREEYRSSFYEMLKTFNK